MALDRALAEVIYLSTLGKLRNPNSEHDPRTLALGYYRNALMAGQSNNYSEYLSVVLRASRSYAAAGNLRADPTNPIVPPAGAVDPTAPPGTTGYRYRVVVDVFEGGQRVGSTAVNVTSPVPLSATEAGFEAVAVARGEQPGRDYRNRVVSEAGSDAEYRTVVIAAGRV